MSSTTIVVQKFEYTPHAPDGTILEVSGRSAGVMGWILDKLNLGTHSSTIVRRGEVEFQFSSLSGVEYIVCPFNAIRCVEAGVSKPFWQLIVGGLLILSSLGMFNFEPLYGVVMLLVGIGLVASYFLTKDLVILFSTGSMGTTRGLAFSSTVLSGKKIDLETILDAIGGINRHLIIIHTTQGGAAPASMIGDATEPASIMPDIKAAEAAFRRGRVSGRAYEQTQNKADIQKALDAFLEAVRLNPDYIEAIRSVAVCYKILGNVEAQKRYVRMFEAKQKAKNSVE